MSDPMNVDTARAIVVVQMADDIHHLLGKAAAVRWVVAAFMALSLVVDLWDRDWASAVFMAMGVVGFALKGRESWSRRGKYAGFVRSDRW